MLRIHEVLFSIFTFKTTQALNCEDTDKCTPNYYVIYISIVMETLYWSQSLETTSTTPGGSSLLLKKNSKTMTDMNSH